MKLAEEKWLSISEENRNKLVANVWCTHCKDAVTIIDYVVKNDRIGVVLRGKCGTCGHEVARVVEMD